jgi:lipopolysaccharide export system protein LptA
MTVRCLIALLACCCASFAHALTTDKDQPIDVKADYAMVNEQDQVSIYTGNVTIDQGTLHIAADRVKIITSGNDVVQIIASADAGSARKAHYEQQPDDKQLVKANADKISYLVQEQRLHLTGNARLERQRDSFQGQLLFYDIQQGVVNLSRGDDQSVHISIQPRAKP